MTQSTHIVAGQTAANGSDVAVTAGTPAVFTLDGAADVRRHLSRARNLASRAAPPPTIPTIAGRNTARRSEHGNVPK
jgi:hypothetical protein